MEFLGDLNVKGHSSYDIHKFEVIWQQNLAGFNQVPAQGPDCDIVLATFLIRHRKFLETRHRLYADFDTSVAEFRAAETIYLQEKLRNPEYAQKLESQAHFFAREWIKTSSLWPVFYMDVMPALESDHLSLLHWICARENLVEGPADKWIWLPPSKVSCHESSARYRSVKLPSRINATKYMLPQLEKFIADGVSALKRRYSGEQTKTTPTIKFIFDHRRAIRPLKIRKVDGAAAIHPFDILYDYFDWASIDANWPEKSSRKYSKWKQVASLSYKISMWLFYDIVADYITSTAHDLTVYLTDNHALPISWFFVKMGSHLCTKNIQFVFSDPAPDNAAGYIMPQPTGENSTASDIGSMLAFYFIHYHEIFRSNGPSPAFMEEGENTIINTMTREGSPLYFRLLDLKTAVLNLPMLREKYSPTPADKEYNKKIIDELIAAGRATPQEKGPELKILIAAPGTGKTTLVNKERGYDKLSRDDIMISIRVGGKTLPERSEEFKAALNELIANTTMDRKTAELMRGTLFISAGSLLKHSYSNRFEMYKIINQLLDSGAKLLVDNVGDLSLPTYMNVLVNKCFEFEGKFVERTFHKNWRKMNYKMVFLYLSASQTYNQQVFRFKQENYLTRFYGWYKMQKRIWDYKYPPEYIEKIVVYATDCKSNLYKIIDCGAVDNTELDKFLSTECIDAIFIKFLNDNYGLDIQKRTN